MSWKEANNQNYGIFWLSYKMKVSKFRAKDGSLWEILLIWG